MQVNSSNGSLQQRFFSGTGSIGGIHLPDFNDKYVFSKKKSGISDEEYRKQIREQAYEDFAKGQFLKLNSSHLEYVMECMKNTTTKITNIKAYMVTALYNAPNTINHYYQQEVQHDMYGGGWHEKGII